MKKKSSSLFIVFLLLLILGGGLYWYGSGDLQGSFRGSKRPDLVISTIRQDSTGVLAVTVKNKGKAGSGNGVTDIYINDMTTPKYTYFWTTLDDTSFLLEKGSSTLHPEILTTGVYSIKACVDSTDAVDESNESNNCTSQTLFVEPDVTGAQINDASSATSDFQDAVLDGFFTAVDALSVPSSGGFEDSSFLRETSGSVTNAGIIYTFGSAADLSGYKGLSYWCRMSETANTITLTIDDDTGPDTTSVCKPTGPATWTFVDTPFALVPSTALDSISALYWYITDSSAVNQGAYDIDRIVLY